jgi:hypothetical protein
MNKIRNIWNEVSPDLKKDKVTPLDILLEQSKAINENADQTNIISLVMSFSLSKDNLLDEVKHSLYLLPKNGRGYNYRFIEIIGKPDSDYPLEVSAYQSGQINFGQCKTEEEFYNKLIEIFNDPRLKIVFEQLKNIGNIIEKQAN